MGSGGMGAWVHGARVTEHGARYARHMSRGWGTGTRHGTAGHVIMTLRPGLRGSRHAIQTTGGGRKGAGRSQSGALPTGGGGGVAGVRTPSLLKSAGDDPPGIWIFKYLILGNVFNFCIFQHFQNKMAENPRRN